MTSDAQAIEDFIARWEPSGGGERSNCQMFLAELCRLLDVGEPEPAVEDESRNAYVFERKVPARRLEGPTTANFIDLYKRGCFVLEAKQSRKRQKQLEELRQLGFDLPETRVGSGRRGGAQWDRVMRQAREQAETYAKRLPPEEGWPPFLIIVDVRPRFRALRRFFATGQTLRAVPGPAILSHLSGRSAHASPAILSGCRY